MAPSKNTEREAREARDRLRRYNARQAVHTHQVSRRRRDNILSLVGLVVIAALATVTQVFYFTAGPGAPKASPSSSPSASPSASAAAGANVGNVPAVSVAADRTWTGTLSLNAVKLGISLNGQLAPQATAVLVQAATDGFYSGKSCTRLVEQATASLLQCGAVSGTTTESGFSFGPIENAPTDGAYPAGTIAMARTPNNPYGNAHQFFIVFQKTTLQNDSAGGYTIVGSVTSGLAALQKQITTPGIVAADAAKGDGAPKVATKITGFTLK